MLFLPSGNFTISHEYIWDLQEPLNLLSLWQNWEAGKSAATLIWNFEMHFRLLLKLTKKEEMEKKKELTLDMLQPSRYKPNDLEQMAEDTKFSKRKIQLSPVLY